jgi:peptidoglycan hydrolase CwlO-like protein
MEKFKQFLYKTKYFLDNYWKVIVICVGVILLMGQCSSCNRDNRADKDKAMIDSLRLENLHLNDRLNDSKTHNDNFTNIATGNQTDLLKQIESKNSEIIELNKKVNNLTSKVNSLTKENDALRKDNIKLNAEVVDLMSKLNK